jgi:hypothetical protein
MDFEVRRTSMDAKATVFIGLLAFSTAALGRFTTEGTVSVDAEEKNNTETWNDKNSYRYPKRWDDAWSATDMGYRVNAGSLNVSRFNYEDDVRIAPRPLEEFTASFTQSRQEDLAEQSIEREIRVGWRFIDGMRFSLLGDVNTLKEFGDMGVALALRESSHERTEIYYWSVDHYYDSKRSDEAATRGKHSQTYGFLSERSIRAGGLGWRIKYELDSPIDWVHPSAGWSYAYEQKRLESRIEVPLRPEFVAYATAVSEEKFEKKTSLAIELDGQVYKSMRRETLIGEVGVEYKAEDETQFTAAIQSIRRNVNYKYGARNGSAADWRETNGPVEVTRNEWGLIFTRHRPITQKVAFQHGAMLNDVRIREDLGVWKTVEVKYQTLFDFTLNENTFLGINTTWDVDQIVRDFPYSKKYPFRPWGGGDLQFMMRM